MARPEVTPLKKAKEKDGNVARKQVTYNGPKMSVRVGAQVIKRGRQYPFDALAPEEQEIVTTDPHFATEEINANGEVIVKTNRDPKDIDIECAPGIVRIQREA